MLEKRWGIFKSGTDIRGFGLGSEDESLYLSDEVITQMVNGFALWLKQKLNMDFEKLVVSVGHDSRLSAQRIKNTVSKTLSGLGIHTLDCGLSSTPAMFMTTVDLNCSGAVQITASHHPFDRNGLKFFTRSGGLEGENILEILETAQNNRFVPTAETGIIEAVDFMDTYASSLREMICREICDYEKPLSGFKIVVDAGNGVGGFYASKVLEPLGADISGSQFLEPDGHFPNHAPNPENKAAMDSLSSAVKNHDADFGIIYDTDVDRAGCAGRGGLEVNRNRLVALAAAIALENNPGGTIVTDSVTSDGLTEFIKQNGGNHMRYKRGYKNVIDKQIELTEKGINCPLAIETSGHAAFKDNYFLDDGAYLITRFIIKMALLGKQGKSLESLIDTLKEPAEECEVRFKISAEDFKPYGEKIIADLSAFSNVCAGWKPCDDNYEGIRISTDENNGRGWLLLRLSVHDPVIVLNMESDIKGGTAIMLDKFNSFIKNYDKLDLSELSNLL